VTGTHPCGDILATTIDLEGETEMSRTMHLASIGLIATVLVTAVACETGEPDPAVRADIDRTVNGYLNALAESYSNLDTSPLEEWASPNEVLAVRKLLTNLARTGDRIQSTLRGYHVENLKVFRRINATVRLVEVWDVVRFDAFSGVEKGRTPNSIQNTMLQLRLVDGRWVVIGRSIMVRETPVPDQSEEGSG